MLNDILRFISTLISDLSSNYCKYIKPWDFRTLKFVKEEKIKIDEQICQFSRQRKNNKKKLYFNLLIVTNLFYAPKSAHPAN